MPARARTRKSTRKRQPVAVPPVRYAVIGLGWIAQVAMLPAFKHAARHAKLTALVSDDPTKLKRLGRKYGVRNLYTYDEFEQCLSGGEVDAIYIALPNHLHAEYTVRAAQAGIHVLCEKPMAVREADCRTMIDACRRNAVKLMVAYRLHFERANLEAVKIAQSGRLGRLRIFNSVFCISVKDADNIRLQAETGGGTLYDVGIYCINAARYLFRAEPTEVFAASVRDSEPRFAEVDEMTSVVMRFPDDRLATLTASFGASDVSSYRIVGDKGSLLVEPAYDYAKALRHVLTINGKDRERTFEKRDQFAPELIHFSQCIRNDSEPNPDGREGLIDVRIIEALYESARRGRPVALPAFPEVDRPDMELEIKRPHARKPEVIHATSPQGK